MAIEIEVKGKKYKSILQACKDKELNTLKLSYQAIKYRILIMGDLESAFTKKVCSRNKGIKIGNKVYDSLMDACNDKKLNKYGLAYSTITERVRLGEKAEDSFNRPLWSRYKTLMIKGKAYQGVREACEDTELNKHNIKYTTICSRLARGMDIEEAFSKPLKIVKESK